MAGVGNLRLMREHGGLLMPPGFAAWADLSIPGVRFDCGVSAVSHGPLSGSLPPTNVPAGSAPQSPLNLISPYGYHEPILIQAAARI
jgi:hypothetical protein